MPDGRDGERQDQIGGGERTYGEFLASEEGMATNVLADRLAWLERQGIVTKARDPRSSRRVVYRVTRKGLDLLPVLLAMVTWSARYDPETAAPAPFVRRIARDPERVRREVEARTRSRPE